MTTTYIGSMDLGTAMPGALEAGVEGSAGINLALPDIQARIDAMLAFNPVPVSFVANIALAQQIIVELNLAITLGISPPSLLDQIAIVSAQVAALLSDVAAINAKLTILADFLVHLSAGGAHLYTYNGAANAAGGELTTEWSTGLPGGGGGGETIDAIYLATNVAATWTAMQAIFDTTP